MWASRASHTANVRRMCCDGRVTDNDTDPALLRSVAEQLASEAAAFVKRRRVEVFGAGSAGSESAVSAVSFKSTETDPFTVADPDKTGLLTELRAREFYEKPTAERKRKKSAAVKRHHKRLRSQMLPKKKY